MGTDDPVARLRAERTAAGITWDRIAQDAAEAVARAGWAHAHGSGALHALHARLGRA